jgi:hypothetical protein
MTISFLPSQEMVFLPRHELLLGSISLLRRLKNCRSLKYSEMLSSHFMTSIQNAVGPFANKGEVCGFARTSINHDENSGRRAIGSKIRLRIKFKINH